MRPWFCAETLLTNVLKFEIWCYRIEQSMDILIAHTSVYNYLTTYLTPDLVLESIYLTFTGFLSGNQRNITPCHLRLNENSLCDFRIRGSHDHVRTINRRVATYLRSTHPSIIYIDGLQTSVGVHSRGLPSPRCAECLYLTVA